MKKYIIGQLKIDKSNTWSPIVLLGDMMPEEIRAIVAALPNTINNMQFALLDVTEELTTITSIEQVKKLFPDIVIDVPGKNRMHPDLADGERN